jgi:kynurenine formamidase
MAVKAPPALPPPPPPFSWTGFYVGGNVGTDAGQAGTFDPPFPNHTTMHGAGKFGITSLINLDQLPPIGAVVIAAPLKIADGSGSPLRVIALAPS